jgi:hypothetical protein
MLFMGEEQFTKDGIQNFYNHNLWADVFLPSYHQQWFFINICTGTFGDNLLNHTYFQSGMQSEITMLPWKITCLIS